jgi:hypothetical protein
MNGQFTENKPHKWQEKKEQKPHHLNSSCLFSRDTRLNRQAIASIIIPAHEPIIVHREEVAQDSQDDIINQNDRSANQLSGKPRNGYPANQLSSNLHNRQREKVKKKIPF